MPPRKEKANNDHHSSEGIPDTVITLETLDSPGFCIKPMDLDNNLAEARNSVMSFIRLDMMCLNEEILKAILVCVAELQSVFPTGTNWKPLRSRPTSAIDIVSCLLQLQSCNVIYICLGSPADTERMSWSKQMRPLLIKSRLILRSKPSMPVPI
ncbi:uncharacterized protein LOC114756005 isoform X2 [Neltuma alba]|nr:uncharacterized protein LOC114756005 isoform X2 [Prosopis alba]XP_028800745.1 uncharacterized protein LOC114756005 isoform X2 [Prosopis alba]XP_028800746.1 uncharacterized protein LOC114756005 isoform X2 [Prosopis alba]